MNNEINLVVNNYFDTHIQIDANVPIKFDFFLDKQFYLPVMQQITKSENAAGDYDYAGVTNAGMLYLYIQKNGRRGKPRKDNTKIEYVREIVFFFRYAAAIGKPDMRELTRFDMETYQAHLTKTYERKTTLSKKVVIMHGFLNWAYKEGYLKKDLCRGLENVIIDKEQIPDRDIDEQVLKQAIMFYKDHPKIQSILILLPTTGLRLNEVITPVWGDLYFDGRQKKYYLKTLTKGGKVRHAQIKEYVLDILIEYRKRLGLTSAIDPKDTTPFYPNRSKKKYNVRSLTTSLSKHMATANLTTVHAGRVTPHFMRHYFARAALAAGALIDWISQTLDHSNTQITKDNYLSRDLKKENDVSNYVDIIL
jgi:integrase/recombinase XerD